MTLRSYNVPHKIYLCMRIGQVSLGQIQVLTNPSVTHQSDTIIAVAEFIYNNNGGSTSQDTTYRCHQTDDLGWVYISEFITDLDKITVELIDENGNHVDLDCQNWSFALEVFRSSTKLHLSSSSSSSTPLSPSS